MVSLPFTSFPPHIQSHLLPRVPYVFNTPFTFSVGAIDLQEMPCGVEVHTCRPRMQEAE